MTKLLGRVLELDQLSEALHSIERRGQAILVHGEPGVGKSSILRAAEELAEKAGFSVLTAAGIEAESSMPYAGLHHLLRPLLSEVDALPAVQRRAILTAFGLAEGPAPELFLIALAALTLVSDAASSTPVVVVIDDLQWLDVPSNEVLSFLARRIGEEHVLLLAALRAGHSVALSSAELTTIEIRGLDDASARELVCRTAMDLSTADREAILEAARGNPLALTELPAAWRSTIRSAVTSSTTVMPLSGRLERAFAARVDELPRHARDVILVAAISSEDSVAEILAAASVLGGTTVDTTALEPAQAAGLLHFDEARVEFRHPLVRSGVLQNESISRRQAANAAMASVLHDQPYRRAWHRSQAVHGPDDSVADELEAGHLECIRRGAIMAAISALERSAQLTSHSHTRGRRLLLAAQHAFGLGRADLVDHLVAAAEHNDLSELDQARVEYLREIFDDGVPGDSRRVVELSVIARRSARAGDPDLALDLLLGAALRCWWADTGAEARAAVVGVLKELDVTETDPRRVAAIAIAEPVLEGTRTVDTVTTIRPETVTDAEELRLLGMAARVVGDEPRAADFFDRAETKLRDQGRLGLLSHVLAVQAAVHVDLGDWRKALDSVEEGVQLARDTGQPNWTAGVTAVEAMVLALTGDIDRALQRSTEVELGSSSRVINDALCNAQLARGFAYLSAGRHADAYAALKPVFDPTDRRHHAREQFSGVMFLAEAAMHSDMLEDARPIIERMERMAAVTSSPVLATQLLYARPLMAADADAEAMFQDGLNQDLRRWPWTKARLQLAYGMWLRRQRRVAESRAPLTAALGAFELIGAVAWAEEARTELRATGARGSTQVVESGPDLLSAQELRIAQLAAEGLSNREIGQQLYLSPRTVGSHLYHMFPKLGIRNRAQLSARLAAHLDRDASATNGSAALPLAATE